MPQMEAFGEGEAGDRFPEDVEGPVGVGMHAMLGARVDAAGPFARERLVFACALGSMDGKRVA